MLNNLFAADVKRKMMNLKQHDLIVQYRLVRRDGKNYRRLGNIRFHEYENGPLVRNVYKEVEDDENQMQELCFEILGKVYIYRKVEDKLNELTLLPEMTLKFIGEAR